MSEVDATAEQKPQAATAPPPPPEVVTVPVGGTVVATRRLALSPLNKRRWQNFKGHPRGYWSFWIFLVLFVVSLLAELIANHLAG